MKTANLFKTNQFRYFLISAVITALILSCDSNSSENEESETSSVVDTTVEVDTSKSELEPVNLENETYSYQTILNDSIGWGYQILKGNKVYINQPHIPAISGNNGFKSEEDASKTAAFAVYKIENGIMPPTLSKSELDSLGVIDIKEE